MQPTRMVPTTCPELVQLLRVFVLTPPVRDAEPVLHRMADAVTIKPSAYQQHRQAVQEQP
ncbi:hypothetical protein GCM10009802_24280 [Streptomyces synnematoformans]|uniref:Transposase n=1 Tax=Streptomyces synnematoformans TaxID=415721 RepID=A0ABP5JTB3_9ACTN